MNRTQIETLASTPARIRALVDGVCETELSHKPAPDVFSLRENVLHVRDIDIEGYERRIVLILAESSPLLPDVDGARLARERDYNNQPLAPALADLAASRARSIVRLRRATEKDLERQAEFEGVGTVTLRRLLEMWIEHDAGHIADMEALRRGAIGRTTADAA
jgi:hypothetical protein